MYFQMNAFKYWFIIDIDIDLFIDIDWLILMMTFDIWNPLHIFFGKVAKKQVSCSHNVYLVLEKEKNDASLSIS